MPEITLRESRPAGYVRVLADGVEVSRHGEYRLAAEAAQRKFGLNDSELLYMYEEYKEDYDSF